MASAAMFAKTWPGLPISAGLGLVAVLLAAVPGLQAHAISPLTLAIIIGMLAGNTVYPVIAMRAEPGVSFARQGLLRLGVVLYGFRLTLQDVGHVGWQGLLIDALMVASTFALSYQVGTRLLGLDRTVAMLVGAGSAICGAAAVLATEPVVRGKPEQASVAVAGVVILGTVAMFLYPFLYDLNLLWRVIPGSAATFGIYIGSTVHEVAQVVAAGRQISPDATGTAVITKMVRVMMLAPFLPLLAAWIRARARRCSAAGEAGAPGEAGEGVDCPVRVPVFALVFIGTVLFNSLHLLPPAAVAWISGVDTWLLATAMAALGLSTHIDTLRRTGGRALLLACVLFAWLVAGGAAVNRGIALLAR
ncbi:MAG: YeiH family putative sulfate export transporter [Gammaproteobacteria bacterium]|nr:YeiH family putative sulfate export transporter [Gammaproteobacteria bacterium]